MAPTGQVCGLHRKLSAGLRRWRPQRSVHDPAKILLDLAITTALGGDCAADIAVLRAQPGMFGPVASDPTVSRTIDRLALAGEEVLGAIRTARAAARAWVWQRTGAPLHDGRVTVDLDATLVIAHSPEGTRDRDLDKDLWPPPAAGVRRPW